MILTILLMSIGFASISTVLYLNGQTYIASNQADFDVYFSKAIENGVEKNDLIQDKTHISFTTELKGIDDTYVLEYEVTNASKNYDANLVMNCLGGNEYLRVENKFDTNEILPARTTRKGLLTLTVIKSVMEEKSISISCEIRGSAVERDLAGGDTIEVENKDYLKTATYDMANYLGHKLNKLKVESITLKKTNEVPEGALESWDVSNEENGSIMAYTLDEDDNGEYELYIGQDGGVKANPNSSFLFSAFEYVTSINGLENLDTKNVINMNSMFSSCRKITELELSHFKTSQVTTMVSMFGSCERLISLDLSHFDTRNVTDMSSMFGIADPGGMRLEEIKGIEQFNTEKVIDMSRIFSNCCKLTSLDLSSWNTKNVINMMSVFRNCSSLTSLNLSNFNTSQVVNMSAMFEGCGNLVELDLSSFDTSNVTDMRFMFASGIYVGSSIMALERIKGLENFDMSNVTDMEYLFKNCNALVATINIRGTNCTSYTNMFENAATENGAKITVNYTEDAAELVDKMIATKSSNSNVIKGSIVV